MSVTFSLQKSKKLLEENGYDCWIVEKPWNPYTKRREDLFNLMDVIGIREDTQGVLGVQACGEDCQSHVHKILEGGVDGEGRTFPPNPYLRVWLKTGNRFFIWSWCLRGAKGKRKMYRLREIEFIIENGQVVHREIPHDEDSVSG